MQVEIVLFAVGADVLDVERPQRYALDVEQRYRFLSRHRWSAIRRLGRRLRRSGRRPAERPVVAAVGAQLQQHAHIAARQFFDLQALPEQQRPEIQSEPRFAQAGKIATRKFRRIGDMQATDKELGVS